MKKLTWTVKISVSENWISDGFELNANVLKEQIIDGLYGAYEYEVDVEIISKPTKIKIRELQN